MSKAISTTTTTASTLPSTSRRRLLAGSGLGVALAIVGLPIAAEAAAASDPVVAIYVKWRAVEDAETIADDRFSELRAILVQRYGEAGEVSANEAWGRDPIYAEFEANRNKSNELSDEVADLVDAMMETPATSLEGIRCKMLTALEVWKFIELPNAREPDHTDTMTVAFLRDAVRVLGGSAAA